MSFESLSADRGLPEITLFQFFVVGDYGKLKKNYEQIFYDWTLMYIFKAKLSTFSIIFKMTIDHPTFYSI